MLRSMTGFASRETRIIAPEGWTAQWDLRGVNAKGLDLRLRLPDWVPGLEADLRKTLAAALGRGSVSLSLRLLRDGPEAGQGDEGLTRLLKQLQGVEAAAGRLGVTLRPPSTLEVLRDRSLSETLPLDSEATEALGKALRADILPLLDDFQTSRAAEGARLAAILGAQVTEIASLTEIASAQAAARGPRLRAQLAENMKAIMDTVSADPDRVAQELVLLAVKSDVTEELDRLRAHVATARALLAEAAPVGRKLDFLCQELNRESNTLCSKSSDAELTRTGLALKTVIDQFREQVQNLE